MIDDLIYLGIAALAIYAIVRQFTEQAVNWRTLLLLPALSAYGSYNEWQNDFQHYQPVLLIAGLALGLGLGVITGIYRARYTTVRWDDTRNSAYSKPKLPSSLIWVGLFVTRIAASILIYTNHDQANMVIAFLAIATSILFLASVSTQKFIVYQKASGLRNGL